MARKSKAKFELKGHTLPGINQKSETVNKADGRSPSSAFQMAEPGDSPLDINFKKMLGTLNPIKTTKNLFGKAKGLLGKVQGAFGGAGQLAGGDLGGGGEDEDAEAGKELLKDEAKESMEEGEI